MNMNEKKLINLLKKYNLDKNKKKLLNYLKEEISDLKDSDFSKIEKIIQKNEKDNPIFTIKFIHYTDMQAASRARVVPVIDKNSKEFKGLRVYDPLVNKEYKYDLRESILKYIKDNKLMKIDEDGALNLIRGCFKITAKVYKKIPKSFTKAELILAEAGYITPPTTPDTDNIAKNLLDSLLKYIYIDDKLNDRLLIEKYYSLLPRLELTLKFRYKLIKSKNIK